MEAWWEHGPLDLSIESGFEGLFMHLPGIKSSEYPFDSMINYKKISAVAFMVMLIAVFFLIFTGTIFAFSYPLSAVQAIAVAIAIWSRIELGLRSFCATASCSKENHEIITTGPYSVVRHPIYSSACVFVWSGIADHLSLISICLGVVVTASAMVRIMCEEKILHYRFPEYRKYSLGTKRLIPYIW